MTSYRDIIETNKIAETNRLSLKRLWDKVAAEQDWAIVWTNPIASSRTDRLMPLEATLISEGFEYFPLRCKYRLDTGTLDKDADWPECRLLFVIMDRDNDLRGVVEDLSDWRVVYHHVLPEPRLEVRTDQSFDDKSFSVRCVRSKAETVSDICSQVRQRTYRASEKYGPTHTVQSFHFVGLPHSLAEKYAEVGI
jgi:hypothetical protein